MPLPDRVDDKVVRARNLRRAEARRNRRGPQEGVPVVDAKPMAEIMRRVFPAEAVEEPRRLVRQVGGGQRLAAELDGEGGLLACTTSGVGVCTGRSALSRQVAAIAISIAERKRGHAHANACACLRGPDWLCDDAVGARRVRGMRSYVGGRRVCLVGASEHGSCGIGSVFRGGCWCRDCDGGS